MNKVTKPIIAVIDTVEYGAERAFDATGNAARRVGELANGVKGAVVITYKDKVGNKWTAHRDAHSDRILQRLVNKDEKAKVKAQAKADKAEAKAKAKAEKESAKVESE